MLTTLRIRNLALVTELTLEFPPGLVVVSGETGAGKSIILGALGLLLGERAERTLIRAGETTCTVEAAFDVRRLAAPVHACLEHHGLEPCEDQQLLLKRTFTVAGVNRQFVNGSPTTLAVLAELGDVLVDVHGPHDHQSLLHPARQLAILDAFGRLQPQVTAFAEQLRERRDLAARKAALVVDERTYAQQLDLLRFQVGEITAAQLRPDEEAEVEHHHQRAQHAARLLQLGQAALSVLGEDEASVLAQAGALGRLLQELPRLDPETQGFVTLHAQAIASLRELQTDLGRYLERIELDPERLHALEERLNLLHSLKRKYGPTLEAVIAFGDDARLRLRQLESRDSELERLNVELARCDQALLTAGQRLSAARRELIPRLTKAVGRQLSDLGFRQCRFEVTLVDAAAGAEGGTGLPPVGATGFDSVEFQFAPNPGEPARPLRAIASSGELARVMLALKTALANEDEIPVLVFDEVDANVGGETAHAVGDKMRRIARHRQVFCVTHLPQVAAAADAHFAVTKETREGRTFTRMQRLDPDGRVTELARMLGGQTDAARQHALALLSP
ncbi:MAG: DNA repair protein RecN [Verrucomicrobia bacterium]|nr:DNA repair protein RecN [Verrucomicrobiota bacterium]